MKSEPREREPQETLALAREQIKRGCEQADPGEFE
jgi:hypothetical protein